jgi:hypothetical protein
MRVAILCAALVLIAAPAIHAQQHAPTIAAPVAEAAHAAPGVTTESAAEAMPAPQVVGAPQAQTQAMEVRTEPVSAATTQITARSFFTIIGVVVVIVALVAFLT